MTKINDTKDFMEDIKKPLSERSFHAPCGFLYIAFGNAFTAEALLSIESLKKHNPNCKVALYTDAPEKISEEKIKMIDVLTAIKPRHIRAKVDFISLTPFERTLYLDSDTVIVRNIEDIFECLDRFDVLVTHDYARKREKYSNVVPEYKKIPYSFSEVNGGVMAFAANERTERFLNLWKEYFYKYFQQTNGWDQVSLRVSLWESEVSINHMPFEYNIRSHANREKQDRFHDQFGEEHMSPRIYHMHYDNEIHHGKFKIETLEELEKIVKDKAVWY